MNLSDHPSPLKQKTRVAGEKRGLDCSDHNYLTNESMGEGQDEGAPSKVSPPWTEAGQAKFKGRGKSGIKGRLLLVGRRARGTETRVEKKQRGWKVEEGVVEREERRDE